MVNGFRVALDSDQANTCKSDPGTASVDDVAPVKNGRCGPCSWISVSGAVCLMISLLRGRAAVVKESAFADLRGEKLGTAEWVRKVCFRSITWPCDCCPQKLRKLGEDTISPNMLT